LGPPVHGAVLCCTVAIALSGQWREALQQIVPTAPALQRRLELKRRKKNTTNGTTCQRRQAAIRQSRSAPTGSSLPTGPSLPCSPCRTVNVFWRGFCPRPAGPRPAAFPQGRPPHVRAGRCCRPRPNGVCTQSKGACRPAALAPQCAPRACGQGAAAAPAPKRCARTRAHAAAAGCAPWTAPARAGRALLLLPHPRGVRARGRMPLQLAAPPGLPPNVWATQGAAAALAGFMRHAACSGVVDRKHGP
jgi:hypothetical protein